MYLITRNLQTQLFFILFCCMTTNLILYTSANLRTAKTLGRVYFPILGFGPWCRGCPANFCDDDPIVVHGYCCGCARVYDNLPIRCSKFLNCPMNIYELCEKYEYMMYCCC